MTSPWQLCWPRLICNTYFCAQRLQAAAAAAVPFLINSTIIVRPSVRVRPSIGCGILSYERAFPKPQTETGEWRPPPWRRDGSAQAPRRRGPKSRQISVLPGSLSVPAAGLCFCL